MIEPYRTLAAREHIRASQARLRGDAIAAEVASNMANLYDVAATCIENEATRADAAERALNTPEVEDFAKGVVLEAQHQRARWGGEHDVGKAPLDWFWLIGYLAQKAATAQIAGDREKALHHTISTAAALANWHAAILGANTDMRPGIAPPEAA